MSRFNKGSLTYFMLCGFCYIFMIIFVSSFGFRGFRSRSGMKLGRAGASPHQSTENGLALPRRSL